MDNSYHFYFLKHRLKIMSNFVASEVKCIFPDWS